MGRVADQEQILDRLAPGFGLYAAQREPRDFGTVGVIVAERAQHEMTVQVELLQLDPRARGDVAGDQAQHDTRIARQAFQQFAGARVEDQLRLRGRPLQFLGEFLEKPGLRVRRQRFTMRRKNLLEHIEIRVAGKVDVRDVVIPPEYGFQRIDKRPATRPAHVEQGPVNVEQYRRNTHAGIIPYRRNKGKGRESPACLLWHASIHLVL